MLDTAWAARTVFKMTPEKGAAITGHTFDSENPEAGGTPIAASLGINDKLSRVEFCTRDFYSVPVGTYIKLTWSGGQSAEQKTVNYDNPNYSHTCSDVDVSSYEIGTVKFMMAGA